MQRGTGTHTVYAYEWMKGYYFPSLCDVASLTKKKFLLFDFKILIVPISLSPS